MKRLVSHSLNYTWLIWIYKFLGIYRQNKGNFGIIAVDMEKSPKLVYNLIGGLPLIFSMEGWRDLCEGVKGAGFECVSALSVRPLATEEGKDALLKEANLTVTHIEEAYKPTRDNLGEAIFTGLVGCVRRGSDGRRNSLLSAGINSVFPGKKTCNDIFDWLWGLPSEPKFISHEMGVDFPKERLLVELNPGLNLSADEIIDWSVENGTSLVFDRNHLLDVSRAAISFPGEPTRVYKGEWEKQFLKFAPYLQGVDINAGSRPTVFPRKESLELIQRQGSLYELAQAAKDFENIQFLRVEIPMPLFRQIPRLSHKKGFAFLAAIGAALRGA